MTRKAQSNRAQKRDEIQARLLEAVERSLAAGESYTELSVERLVKEAGLSRSTFYVYFEDKGDLLRALVSDVIGELIGSASVWWELPPDASRDDVRKAMGGIFETWAPHGLLISAVVDTASYDPTVRETFNQGMAATIEGVANHIRAGQEQGSVRKGIDPATTAAWLTWMTERGLYQMVPGSDTKQVATMAESLTTILWNTLYAGARD